MIRLLAGRSFRSQLWSANLRLLLRSSRLILATGVFPQEPRDPIREAKGSQFLAEIASDLEPEDGVLWVCDSTEYGCYGVTLFGLESVQEILNDKPTLAFIKERMERDNSKE